MTDFIIVGRGLAATCLMHAFRQNNISFTVIADKELSNCSQVAAGIWNPVVFKRLTKSWLAGELINTLKNFYSHCEQSTGLKFLHTRKIIRPFSEEQEKILWKKKSKNELDEFLDPVLYEEPDKLPGCKLSQGYSFVLESGNLDVAEFLKASAELFSGNFINEEFKYKDLEVQEGKVNYKNHTSKAIIFCEGHLVRNNPFFNWIPLKPAKGEIVNLKVNDLDIGTNILNKSAFLFKSKGDIFRLGATYEWDELNEIPTQKGLADLLSRLDSMVLPGYEVVDHRAGVRPSSLDRRPIVGPHPVFSNLYVFNGLGTKGVMLAPYFVNNFVNFYLQKESIHKEVSVKRFYHFYEESK